MQIRVAILPPQNISQMSGSLAKKYAKKFTHWFVVDNQKLFPHITLFCVDVSRKNLKELIRTVAGTGKKFKKFNLAISGHSLYPGGWLGLKIRESKELKELRRSLFVKLKPFGPNNPKLKSAYSPHVTLTKFKNGKHGLLATKGSKIPITKFKADTIALCLDKNYSQVYKIIKTFKLKS